MQLKQVDGLASPTFMLFSTKTCIAKVHALVIHCTPVREI